MRRLRVSKPHQPICRRVVGQSLDADETVLDNSQYQLEQAQAHAGYSDDTWAKWVKRKEATPLPGVTPASTPSAAASRSSLTACSRSAPTLRRSSRSTRLPTTPSSVVWTEHRPTRTRVFARSRKGRSPLGTTPLTIVAFVGDNILDFPGLSQGIRSQGDAAYASFGVQYFLLPNPMYGSWQ
ncbi:MAG: HAD family acid phosphatase [Vicinamibacterales bacterium]